jgi:hypothetical protein
VVAALTAAACTDDQARTTGADTQPPPLNRLVAGGVLLDRAGRFQLDEPRAPDDVPIISAERAGELADAWVHTYAAFFRRSWAERRGTPVDVTTLAREPRVYYAETPYEKFPESWHPSFRRHYGPFYLAHFTAGPGGPRVLTVAVAAYNTDVTVDRDGKLQLPTQSGGDFFPMPVSTDPARYAPLSPEEAAQHVATATGARVARTPRLVLMDRDIHPAAGAVWELALDREVGVRPARGGERARVRTVYVGAGKRLLVARPGQARGQRVTIPDPPAPNPGSRRSRTVDVSLRPGMNAAFDAVTLDEAEG